MDQNVIILAWNATREGHNKRALLARLESLRDCALLVIREGGPVENDKVSVGPKAVRHEVVLDPVKQNIFDFLGITGLITLEPLRALFTPLE